MAILRQEYWNGLPFPPPGDLPDSWIKHTSPAFAGGLFTTEPPRKPIGWPKFCYLLQPEVEGEMTKIRCHPKKNSLSLSPGPEGAWPISGKTAILLSVPASTEHAENSLSSVNQCLKEAAVLVRVKTLFWVLRGRVIIVGSVLLKCSFPHLQFSAFLRIFNLTITSSGYSHMAQQ